jgi:hypothetical protein
VSLLALLKTSCAVFHPGPCLPAGETDNTSKISREIVLRAPANLIAKARVRTRLQENTNDFVVTIISSVVEWSVTPLQSGDGWEDGNI